MTWFANVHGGFEGPEGWAELPSIGLVDDLPEPLAEPPVFRRSAVLSGETLPAGSDLAAYVTLQKTLLAGTLPGFTVLAELPPAHDGTAGYLYYRVEPPMGDPLVQRQAYFTRDGRVAVLTWTVQDGEVGTTDEDFARAVETYVSAV